jgi:hypothetical protein
MGASEVPRAIFQLDCRRQLGFSILLSITTQGQKLREFANRKWARRLNARVTFVISLAVTK